MKIAICDDLESDRQVLIHMIKKYCKDYNLELELYAYENGEMLLSDFNLGNFKIIFLDIYMNDKNNITGIEIAREIRIYDKDVILIFMTTSNDHALDAFDVDAMQYLVNPVSYEKLYNIFNKCQKLFADNMRFIEVPSSGLSVKIFLKDIYYIEVYNKISLIHTNTQIVKTYTSLSKLWELVGGTPFLRCNRSYIVNMFYIDDILDSDFLLKNGDKVPIRKEESSNIKQAYSDYFFEQMRSGENNV